MNVSQTLNYGAKVIHLRDTLERLEPQLEKQIFKYHRQFPNNYRLLRDHSFRERRLAGPNDVHSGEISIALPVNGIELQLTLTRSDIVDPGLTLTVPGEGEEETEFMVEQNCHFAGGDESIWVVISTCSGINGIIDKDGHSYQIEQITSNDERLSRHRRHIQEPLIIIYPLKTRLSENPKLMQMSTHPVAPVEGTHTMSRKKRRISLGPYTVEVAVFIDRTLYDYIGKRYPSNDLKTKAVEIVMTLVNAVHRLYSDSSLGETVRMLVKKIEVLPSNEPNSAKGNIYKYLKNFCYWQEKRNPEGKAGHWDHALLLSGIDLWNDKPSENSTVGLAYVGGMCTSSYSCTVNEATSFAAAYIIAHEMGHNFDMKHDGSDAAWSCNPNEYIMSPVMASGATVWSTCSKKAMKTFLENRGDCLVQSATSSTKVGDKTHEGAAPGKRFDADDQCHYMYGQDWKNFKTSEAPFNNVCREIWCRKERLLKTPTASALEGTPCGKNKACKNSKCVKRDESDGNTSEAKVIKIKGKKKNNLKKKKKKKNKKVIKKKKSSNAKKISKKKNNDKNETSEKETKSAKKGEVRKTKKLKDKKKKEGSQGEESNPQQQQPTSGADLTNAKNRLTSNSGETTSVKTKIKINGKRKNQRPKKIRRIETPTHYVIKERLDYIQGKGWRIKIIRIKKTKSMMGKLDNSKNKKKKKKKRKKCKRGSSNPKCIKKKNNKNNNNNNPNNNNQGSVFYVSTKSPVPDTLDCKPEKVKRVEGKGWWVRVPRECVQYMAG
ncbi:Adt-1p [Halocaridina rubra]|uniref:Adt-1p n=1 Tax=Halocaridina rubra TaxID=373956 RepID=A0AAN8X6E8_HALRR